MTGLAVSACWIKSASGARMVPRKCVELRAAQGIVGDVGGVCGSPRQVLLVDSAAHEELLVPPDALRANLLVKGLRRADLQSGDMLSSGLGLVLRVTMPCPPCGKLNGIRAGLAADVGAWRGTLARVIASGPLTVGDPLLKDSGVFNPISQSLSRRVSEVMTEVPTGRVTTFGHLTVMAGVPLSYARVMPRTLASVVAGTPTHRVVTSDGRLSSGLAARRAALLAADGVEVTDGQVPESAVWRGDPFVRHERDVFDSGRVGQ